MRGRHLERHLVSRIGWLRAAVVGANNGIASTASLIVGIAAAGAARGDIIVAGAAALVAGAMSMAAGEYVSVGSQSAPARQVAVQLMAKDALGAHARDELNIVEAIAARPVQAAWASAATFVAGAILPFLVVLVAPGAALTISVVIASLLFLTVLGALGARAGGADLVKGVVRITLWGALALGVAAGVGRLFGAVV